jgi:hypothetical protein
MALIDLSTAAAQKLVREAPRSWLDKVRDAASKILDSGLDLDSVFGSLIGLLAGAAAGRAAPGP